MANEKRLIDAYKLEDLLRSNSGRYHHKDDIIAAIAGQPTVDAVEVCYCDNCVNHGNCLPEDIFRMVRIEKPYCCAGKVDGDTNA